MRLHYRFVAWVARTGFRLFYGIHLTGIENIPREGTIIIASNHRSNYDPPILGSTIPREVHYFAKAELFNNPIIGKFLRSLNAFPVKRGRMDRAALNHSVETLKQGEALIFFPEGTRAPNDGFLRAKEGIGWLVANTNAPVLPVYVHGSTVKKFQWRRRPAIHVVFGNPVSAATLYNDLPNDTVLHQLIADRVLDLIRDLSLLTPDNKVKQKGNVYDRAIIENKKLR